MGRAMNGLWTCLDEIKQQLTPTLGDHERLAPLLEADNPAAFLHALSASGVAVHFHRKKWEPHALWIDDGALSPSMITVIERLDRVAVMKSGKQLVDFSIIDRKLYIASLDGTFIRWLADGKMVCDGEVLGVAVDSEWLIWVRQQKKISCFTEDGQLVRVVQLTWYPTVMTSLSGGRLLIGGHDFCWSRLLLVSPGCEHPSIFLESPADHLSKSIHDLQVCFQTGEIYVLRNRGEVSVFSLSDGKFYRSFSCAPMRPWAMVLSADGRHIFFSEPDKKYISVWTSAGHLVCKWPLKRVAYYLALLPFGKVLMM